MRLPMTKEMRKMWVEIKPYLVMRGFDLVVKDDAPQRIIDMDKRLTELRKEQFAFAESLMD